MRLIVITPEQNILNEAAIVNELFEAGLERLHVRKKELTNGGYVDYLNSVDKKHQHKIVISEHYGLWKELQLGGIHLNSHARANPIIWEAIKDIPPRAISTSFHSWQEITANEFPYSYVFISPVFDSISKRGYTGSIDLAAITATRNKLAATHKYCPEIIALGGIDKHAIPVLMQYGFNGAALLGAVWQAADPVVAFIEILEAANKA